MCAQCVSLAFDSTAYTQIDSLGGSIRVLTVWCLWLLCLMRCRRAVSRDRRAEPLVGQRVPYVIVYGTPGLPLIQLVRSPHDVLGDPSLRINVTYYITKQILPSLGRIFSLLGVDVMTWYSDLPRVTRSACYRHSSTVSWLSYNSCAQWSAHSCEPFLNFHVGFGFDFVSLHFLGLVNIYRKLVHWPKTIYPFSLLNIQVPEFLETG